MVEDETKDTTMELFIHRAAEERVTLRTVATTVSIDTAVQLQDGEQVWLAESVEAVDVTLTLAECGIPHRGHVHVNRCAQVATSVTYNGVTKEHTFAAATRFERVFEWAVGKHGFALTPTDATEHALQISGTTQQPDDGDHIGSFVGEHCSVRFDLVPKHRFEG